MPYIFGKLWHLAIIWAIRKAFQCILQGVRILLANHTRISPTSDNESYIIYSECNFFNLDKVDISPSRSEMSDDFISLFDFNSLFDPVFGFRQEQGDRSWQPFGERKNGHKSVVRRIFAIFTKIILFLRAIANLKI